MNRNRKLWNRSEDETLQLISLYREAGPSYWDKNDKEYDIHTLYKRLHEQLIKKKGVSWSVKEVRHKIKSLRTTYTQCLRRLLLDSKMRDLNSVTYPSWVYFKAMDFLRPHTQLRGVDMQELEKILPTPPSETVPFAFDVPSASSENSPICNSNISTTPTSSHSNGQLIWEGNSYEILHVNTSASQIDSEWGCSSVVGADGERCQAVVKLEQNRLKMTLTLTESHIHDPDESLENSIPKMSWVQNVGNNHNAENMDVNSFVNFDDQDKLLLHSSPVTKQYSCDLCPMSFAFERVFKAHKILEHEVGPAWICRVCGMQFLMQESHIAHVSSCHDEGLSSRSYSFGHELNIRQCHNLANADVFSDSVNISVKNEIGMVRLNVNEKGRFNGIQECLEDKGDIEEADKSGTNDDEYRYGVANGDYNDYKNNSVDVDQDYYTGNKETQTHQEKRDKKMKSSSVTPVSPDSVFCMADKNNETQANIVNKEKERNCKEISQCHNDSVLETSQSKSDRNSTDALTNDSKEEEKKETGGQRNRVHKCPLCPAQYPHACRLRYHMRLHSGERPFVCNYCSLPFSTASARLSHVKKVHLNLRPHLCDLCGKRFKDIQSLQGHVNAHLGIKKYECGMCSRRFTKISTMKTHMRQHTGAKPYVCDHCGQAFTVNVSLRAHLKSKHGMVVQVACPPRQDDPGDKTLPIIGRPKRNQFKPQFGNFHPQR